MGAKLYPYRAGGNPLGTCVPPRFHAVLGRYCRERGLFPFATAVRRMTSLPADRLRLPGRGQITPGSYADLVVLDPATIADTATWADPHRYAVGVRDVVVNGTVALAGGELTGAPRPPPSPRPWMRHHPGRRDVGAGAMPARPRAGTLTG